MRIKAARTRVCEAERVNAGVPSLTAPTPAVEPAGAGVFFADRRLRREWRTMTAMVEIYCRGRHGARGGALCPECADFLTYAGQRLQRCRFGSAKPTCARCPVHCYNKTRREQVKTIMRYAGPRMLWEHPWLSLRHWLDGGRKIPALTRNPAQ